MADFSDRLIRKLRQLVRVTYATLIPAGNRMLVNNLAVKEAKIEDLREKLSLSHKKNKILHQKNLLLEEKDADIVIHNQSASLDELTRFADYEFEILNLKDQIQTLRKHSKLAPDVKRTEKLRQNNEDLKRKLRNAVAFNRTYGVLVKYLSQENNLNNNAFSIVSEQQFDYVIAHDILGLFAANTLAAHYNCPLIVDLVEEHDLMKRSGDFFRKNLSESEAKLINQLLENMVNGSDRQLLIGPMQYQKYIKSVRKKGAAVLPNYRDRYLPTDDNCKFIDDMLQNIIGLDQEFICVPNRIIRANELKLLIGAIAKARVKLPILHVGTPLTAEARIEVADYCNKKKVQFYELGILEYEQYREVLRRAVFCSFITQETAYNVKYAFPNRLFDAISTQTPILTTGFVQVGEFIREKSIGVYVDDKQTITRMSEAVSEILLDRELYQNNLKKVSKVCSWSSIFKKVFRHVQAGSRVLIVTRKDVRQNQRVRNFYHSFKAKGCHVTVIGGHRTEYNVLDRSFYTLPLSRAVTEDELYAAE